MLTADLIRPRLRPQGNDLHIDGVDPDDAHWLHTAADLIALLQAQPGRSRGAWETALDSYLGERVDYVVVRGLAKVLTDAATYSPVETVLLPAAARQALFVRGPAFMEIDLFHPRNRDEIVSEAAGELGLSAAQLEAALFADRLGEHVLTDIGPTWTPTDLLARYNLELARGVLYWASKVTLQIYDHYKSFWRYLKLFKLMFEARPIDGGYHIDLDGPISPFVTATLRYGRQFAAFLPALLLGERWQMAATIHLPQSPDVLTYRLDHRTPLKSHFKQSGLFDSRLEADFAAEFESKFGGERGKWLLSREDEVLLLGDTVMIPDFAITNKTNGKRALVELVGFWHPDYLRRKVEKVRAAKRRNLLLVVYEGVNLSADKLRDVPSSVLYFKQKPVLKDVMAAVQKIAK